MSVKVAVRVRPFNNRQINLGCTLCVDMEGKTTRLLDFGQQKKTKEFAFDYSFWSHDQFETDEDGYCKPTGYKYADQKIVYDSVGKEILDNAWQGYHCCLFAYGQTGSGKSYSMIGYGANSGIVPISCQKIFEKIASNQDKNKEFEVQISMMEIYNQKVQDLLVAVNKRSKQGLKIREHKTQGVYVQGLTKHYVNTYQSIKAKMEEGNTHRSVAATQMNASSSRAHTIISLQFRQKQTLQDKKVQKISIIHLVDLAGSQRVEKTGAQGTRLKQAAGINKSLSVLGLVISNLADKAMGKGKNTVIPYRDSCLTRILQNALGGNSKTLMICAISPASDNYDQTLSTLRYADQAKKIQNKAVINENQTDKMIRELTQQNQKLKKMMELFNKMGIDFMDQATLQRFYQAKSQLHFNNEMMKGYTMTNQQKQAFSEIVQQFDEKQPHIVNLNQDPMLSKKVKYPIADKNLSIGKKQADPINDIIIGGVGIVTHHAIIFKYQNSFYFKPLVQTSQTKCYINGQQIKQKTQLFNKDRLICGTNSTFLILIDGQQRQNQTIIDKQQIDWQFAQDELYEHRKKQINQFQVQKVQKHRIRQSIMRKQLQIQKIQLLKQNEAKILQLKNQNIMEQQKYKQQFQKLKLQIELQKQKYKKIQKQNGYSQNNSMVKEKQIQSHQNKYFEKKLINYIPKLTQVNEIAKQFDRKIYLIPKIVLMSQVQRQKNQSKNNKLLRIKVVNFEVGYDYLWSLQKFQERYYEIKDLYQNYLESQEIPQLQKQNDPFWDPAQDTHICYGYLTMMNLPYLLDNQTVLSLVDQNGQCGKLTVSLTPTDQTGTTNRGLEKQQQKQQDSQYQDQNIEDELLGKPFYFTLQISGGRIPQNYNEVFIEYSIKLDQNQKQLFKTQRVSLTNSKVNFNYKYLHKVYNMTQQVRDYFKNTNLCLDLYGISKFKSVESEAENKENNSGVKNANDLIQKLLDQIPKHKVNVKRDDGCSLI